LKRYSSENYNYLRSLRWHFLSVDRFVWNVLYSFRISGITVPYEENYVYPYADSTYSYIFIRDINDYATDQGWTDDRRYLKEWIVFAHELGHQRAGLTHPDGDTSSYYCPYCHNVVWDSSY